MTVHIDARTHRTQLRQLLISLGLLVAFAVRLYRLGAESFWYDETVSAYLARQPLREMIAHTALDIHPPGYYALLHGWVTLTSPWMGSGLEYLLAFISVWFGVVTVSLLVPIGVRTVGSLPTIIAVWIAALHPFLVWYSQEVRMYALAGALALLCTYAALRFVSDAPAVGGRSSARAYGWLAVYVAAATMGLYTLYYFVFTLIALNVAALISGLAVTRHGRRIRTAMITWVLAQLAILLLFAPWLPLLLRQVVRPPVPTWRVPWTGTVAFLADLSEALAALTIGQSVPSSQLWGWALLSLFFLVIYYGYAKPRTNSQPSPAWIWPPILALVPLLLLFAISLSIVPIYHVRYLATYAPVYALISAASLLYLYRRSLPLFFLFALVMVFGSGYSLTRFWQSPLYRADDHRAAVALLADQWRPGDAILSNAGWTYTAIDTYWPDHVTYGKDAIPGSAIEWHRLADAEFDQITDTQSINSLGFAANPQGYTTGSVEGDPSLGWGSPDADFYAMSRDITTESLGDLSANSERIWHYRLYDTVNDPDGVIRTWLDEHLQLQFDVPIPGRDYLRLQRFAGLSDTVPSNQDGWTAITLPEQEIDIDILSPSKAFAGHTLYVPMEWTYSPDASASNGLSISLRLMDADGVQWAQHDEALPPPNSSSDTSLQFIGALPIPADTPPGDYTLQLVVYRTDNLEPLVISSKGNDDSAATIATVQIELADDAPVWTPPLVSFDYIDLASADIVSSVIQPDSELQLNLVWRPRKSHYRDVYSARNMLINEKGIVAEWEQQLGGSQYPSSIWAADYPVRDQLRLSLPEGVPAGDYQIRMSVIRNSDGEVIPAKTHRFLPFSKDSYTIGEIRIGS